MRAVRASDLLDELRVGLDARLGPGAGRARRVAAASALESQDIRSAIPSGTRRFDARVRTVFTTRLSGSGRRRPEAPRPGNSVRDVSGDAAREERDPREVRERAAREASAWNDV